MLSPAESPALSPSPAYMEGLNDAQRQAVETLDGPLLVLAGAGTGKTRVLTTRIAHLLHQRKAYPGQILAVTFTNKAAREMSHRVEKFMGLSGTPLEENSRGPIPWLGTFHSLATKILRRHAELIDFPSSFTILDADDQLRLLKTLMQEKKIDVKQHAPKGIMGAIQSWKDLGLTPADVTVAHMRGNDLALSLYHDYQARLKTLSAMDFGDLLLHNLTLFRAHPNVAQEYAQRFHYILVDEYQDTNVAQYLWLRLLALGHKNVCCVGDDDQSIYGWRGAEVGNILRFEQDFPDAVVVRLEQNYRSTKHILAAASGLITHNEGRLGKTLWTESEGGEAVRLRCLHDSDEEAYFVGEEVESAQRLGHPLNDIAILVRASFQTRSFEDRFLTMGLSYRVIGGLRFYERQEIRDAIAYMRVMYQPDDDLAFERIINTPKRGVGKATLENIHTTARGMKVSLYRALEQMLRAGSLKGKVAEQLRGLQSLFEIWRNDARAIPLNELAEKIVKDSGYQAMWEADKSPEAAGRLENLRELFRAMGEFEDVQAFLEHVGLVTDQENATNDGQMVSLMTLHAAKGLEFPVVFLPGWEEGLFPHQRALDEVGQKGLEEERRLAYVGITRARELLYITRAERRRFFAKGGIEWQTTLPSRFLSELPDEHIVDLGGGRGGAMGTSAKSRKKDFSAEMAELFTSQWNPPAPVEATPEVASAKFKVGDKVTHKTFGRGTVLLKDGNHVDVFFEKVGKKKLLADYLARES